MPATGGYASSITIGDLEIDPFPIYARLRRDEPVAYVPAANIWFATRWEDVDAVGKRQDMFSAEYAGSPIEVSFGKPAILTCDGATHKALRDGIDPHYRPRNVASYAEALVRPIAEDRLARLRAAGHGELIADYFEPISALSLARSFGIVEVDDVTLRRWFHGLSQGAINYERDAARQAICDTVCREIDAAVLPLLERLRREPDSSPLSHMLHGGMAPGESRDPTFILPTVKITLLGGMQEPGHGAGSTLVGLLQNPEQFEALKADPVRLLPAAIDEGLRWVAPIGTIVRTTKEDVPLGGTIIPKGAPVAAVLASANHDGTRFENPGRYDLFRGKSPHGAFGFGHHFCAGKWFAKAQMEIALRVLLEGLPKLRLADGHEPRFRGWEFRAPTALQVVF
jgi:cytochrome P450